jgi:hypothetical protein
MAGFVITVATSLAQGNSPAMANSTATQSLAGSNETDSEVIRLPINIDLFKELEAGHIATAAFNPEQDHDRISIIFSEISLPPGAYLQIIPSGNEYPITYNYPEFYDPKGSTNFESDPVSAEGVSVRLVYPDGHKIAAGGKANIIGYRLTKNSTADGAPNTARRRTTRAIIGGSQMKHATCYQEINPNFYRRSLSVAKINNETESGSGWNITGADPYVMTNHHVAGGIGPKRHSLIYNYESPTCDPASAAKNTLAIKTEAVVASGGGDNENDWSVYKADELAWQEAGIIPFFGSLWMDTARSTPPQLNNLPLFIPQHAAAAVKRMTHLNDDGTPCGVTKMYTSGNGKIAVVQYNCDTYAGSSGSPVLSQQSYGVIAEHYAGLDANYGVGINRIYSSIASIIPDANRPDKAVVGKGKVLVSNVAVVPHIPAEVSLGLRQALDLKALDDTRLTNYGKYYLFKAKGRGADGRIKTLNARLSLQPGNNSSAAQRLSISFLPEDNPGITSDVFSGWMAFYLNDYNGGENLANLIVPFTWEKYDPFISPFPPGTEVPEYTVTAGQPAVTGQIRLSAGNFGFTTLRTGQGPMSLIAGTTGFSTLSVQVKDESGQTRIMKLRGQRKIPCSRTLRQMNDYAGCVSGDKLASLVVSYKDEDNPDLPKGRRYQGVLPVQAQRDTSSMPLLINIDVKT